MKKVLITLAVVTFIFFVIPALFLWGSYNGIVDAEQTAKAQWSQVENQYQRRSDLVPNLVNTVKGVANFERQTYTAVTEARAKVGQINLNSDMLSDPAAVQKFQAAQNELSGALSRLLVVMENYPNLKANENFLTLQAQLEGTENRISVERRRYNETAQAYNTKIKRFPVNIVAGIFGFGKLAYFEAAKGAEKAPEVKF